ncbi:hypothetical protein CCR85_04970 [Rhodothalassium salexigens]|uniref:TonB-dependent hemoglobin/transferrin/lactoferrin family receptor n=1 Tax=Rhodothalassium salexigens TaxID=1086 RepID=UPI001911F198|nr:TonB-dependent hemoglobin/transferrin/lactoferrin family receptor [Rhodothalassium salexigens]MBK5910844.1 hypothetical protein [Rhodothalassium salexigens]
MSPTPFSRSSRFCRLFSTVSPVAVGLAFLALGQGRAAAADLPDSVAADNAEIDEIVVTATRTERERFKTPVATSVINRDMIDAAQPYGYQDIFETIPGVEIQGGARRIAEEPNVRGFSDEQVVIRIDGARQNFDLGHRGRFFVDPDLLSGIEVVRGSASALYGSGALGGVISLETREASDLLRPGETYGARVKLGYRQQGNEPLVSAGAFGDLGVVDVFVNGVYRQVFDDLEDGSGDPIIDSEDRIFNGIAVLGFDLGDQHRLKIVADILDNDGENPTNANSVSSDTTVVDRETQERGIRFNYRYGAPTLDLIDFNVAGYYQTIDLTEDRRFDGRVDTSDFESFGIDAYNISDVYDSDLVSLRLTYGVEAFKDQQSGERDRQVRLQFPDAERSFVALYAQSEIDLFDGRVSIIPGLRWDNFSLTPAGDLPEIDRDRVTPRVSVGFSPIEQIYVWGGYSEAFRAPSLTQSFADGVHFTVPLGRDPETGIEQIVVNQFVPNAELEPEETRSYEIGIRAQQREVLVADDYIEASFTAYRSDVDNYIDQRVTFIAGPPSFQPPAGPLIFPGTTSTVNVDARIEGLEMDLRYDAPRFMVALAGHAIDGDNRLTGAGIGSIPQNRLTIQAEGRLPNWGLRGGTRVTLAAAQDDVPEENVIGESYETVDLYASWTPRDGTLEGATFTVGLDNIFDQTFSIFPTVINQPGFGVRLTASYRFGA